MGSFDPTILIIIAGIVAIVVIFCCYSVGTSPDSDSPANPIAAATSGGLDATLIETFPTFLYSEVKHLKIGKGDLECAVCLNEFEDHETLRLLPCDHVFHSDCIDKWLSSRTTCPVCRANLAEPDTHEKHPLVASDSCAVDGSSVTIEVAEDDDGGSIKSTKWSKYPRSHSTGHSLVQPGENVDRFTLKLPDQIRQEMMTRASNQTTSLSVLPRETSSRRGYRAAGVGEGSNRGKSYMRLGSLDRPDRWMFTVARRPIRSESKD